MDSCRFRGFVLLGLVAALLLSLFVTSAAAQGLRSSPYSAPSMLRGLSSGGLDLAPSNPLGLPGSSAPGAGGSGSLYVSEGLLRGILPLIPNLQFGYLHDFGNNRVSSGRLTADYLLPLRLSGDSVIFGEAHTEFQDFWKTLTSKFTSGTTLKSRSGFNNRVDMSFGGGYRTLLRRNTLLGVNGFYDTSRLGGTWYPSGGVGLEMAARVSGNDAIDLNFNWYGQLFNSTVIRNAFRYGPSNYDFEAGYSHELWNGGPDLRLKVTGYQFDIGNRVYGWNAGAELKSRDGMFVLRYDVGHDKVNQTYQTVGGFVNVGFQLENLLKGESPFTMPEPIFKSPRSLRYMLTQKVKRDWHQPTAVVSLRNSPIVSGAGKPYFVLDLSPTKAPFPSAAMVFASSTQTSATFEFTYTGGGNPQYIGNLYLRISIAGGTPASGYPVNNVQVNCQDGTLFDTTGVPFLYFDTNVTTLSGSIPSGGYWQIGPDLVNGYGMPMSDVNASGGEGTITITHPDVQTMVITVKAN